MLSFRRILVVHNPAAGHRKLVNIVRRLESRFRKEKVDFVIRETAASGDGLRWSRLAHAEGYDLVVVSGGDGTVREVVEGLMRSGAQVPMAVIPAGTGNVTALSLSIPIEIRKALDLIFKGKVQRFDVGYLPEHDRYFMFVVGAGYDAHLIHETPRELKKSLGFFAYIATGIKWFFKVRRVDIELELDNEVQRIRAHTIMAINFGGIANLDWQVGPDIDPHDGKLNIMVLSTRSIWGSLLVIFKLLFKSYHGYRRLEHFKAQRIRVKSDPPLPVQMDGEALGSTPFVAHLIPDGIPVVVPIDYE